MKIFQVLCFFILSLAVYSIKLKDTQQQKQQQQQQGQFLQQQVLEQNNYPVALPLLISDQQKIEQKQTPDFNFPNQLHETLESLETDPLLPEVDNVLDDIQISPQQQFAQENQKKKPNFRYDRDPNYDVELEDFKVIPVKKLKIFKKGVVKKAIEDAKKLPHKVVKPKTTINVF